MEKIKDFFSWSGPLLFLFFFVISLPGCFLIKDCSKREEREMPNFTLIKNSFDAIDLRKDGIIDRIEWCRAFASYNGKLDFKKENVSNGFEFYDKKKKNLWNSQEINKVSHNRKILRDWETSGDVSYLYKYINKNRK